MSLFDRIGEITRNVGDRTSSMIEINKLNGKIRAEKSSIEAVKAELGALYWTKYDSGAELDADGAELCEKIRHSVELIEELEAEIQRIREEMEKKPEAPAIAEAPAVQEAPAVPEADGTFCAGCGEKLVSGAKFCTRCGAPAAPIKRVCPGCGVELAQAVMAFCTECGMKL